MAREANLKRSESANLFLQRLTKEQKNFAVLALNRWPGNTVQATPDNLGSFQKGIILNAIADTLRDTNPPRYAPITNADFAVGKQILKRAFRRSVRSD